jgi:hypothetical protein
VILKPALDGFELFQLVGVGLRRVENAGAERGRPPIDEMQGWPQVAEHILLQVIRSCAALVASITASVTGFGFGGDGSGQRFNL